MSDETYRAVEEAIQRHLADENDGALLRAWHVVASGVSVNSADETCYQYMNHDGPPHEWIGLLTMSHRRALRWQTEGDT